MTRPEKAASRVVVGACLCVTIALVGFALRHAGRVPHFAGDDLTWRAHAAGGFRYVWTEPSPFLTYRPVFGTWLHGLQQLGLDSPAGLAVGTLLLYLIGAAAAYWAVRPLTDALTALMAATVVCLHPARQQQLFWTSAGIDTLALVVSLVGIGLAVRTHRAAVVSPASYVAVAVTTALAVLSKEIALALPLAIALLPGSVSVRRRLSLAAASGAGAAVASVAWLAMVGGGGRPAGLMAIAGSPAMLLYPTRLVWPGDFQAWTYRANLGGDFLPLLGVGALSAAAILAVWWAWRGRLSHPVARAGLLLTGIGALPWLIRQDDRAIGLGIVGAGLLVSGAVRRTAGGSRIAGAVVVVLALCWSPLWVRWEARWVEASRLSGQVVGSWTSWRGSAPPGVLLVGIGTPSLVGWTSEVTGLGELDRCALDMFGVVVNSAESGVEVALHEPPNRLRVKATGDTILRWGTAPLPSLGVTAVDVDRSGYVRGGVIDADALEANAIARGCSGIDVRRWNGREFVR